MVQNIFGLAMRIIPKQSATLFRFAGRETNETGLDVNTYAQGETITGSIQAVDRTRYGVCGLDAAKSYISVYSGTPIDDTGTDRSPDYIVWQGRKWEVVNRANWREQADFNGVLAQDVGAADGSEKV